MVVHGRKRAREGARHLHHLQARRFPTATNHRSNHSRRRYTSRNLVGSGDRRTGALPLPPPASSTSRLRNGSHLSPSEATRVTARAVMQMPWLQLLYIRRTRPVHRSTSPSARARERRTGIGGGGGAPSEGDGRAKGRSARRRSLRERHDSNVARLVSGERQVGRVFVCSQ